MSHSLELDRASGVNSRLAHLHALGLTRGKVTPGAPIVPGIHFDSDPDAPVEIRLSRRGDELFTVEFNIRKFPRWVALHISLEGCDLRDKMMLGVAIRSRAPRSCAFKLCMRDNRAAGFDDIFFRKTIVAHAEPSLHLDALVLDEHPRLDMAVESRELIMFFEPQSSLIEFQDLRVFLI
jgi:hypothetical protein